MNESDLVFNLVWTGGVYDHLRYFVFSMFDQTDCQFRFIANNCTPSSVAKMRQFAAASDRVVEVFEVGQEKMLPHGHALDPILFGRDEGDLFCFIDVDIKALAPFVGDFLPLLDSVDAVTSGREVWTDTNVLEADGVGIGGRHFYDSEGFIFGSPHFGIYRKAALLDTLDRWGITMHCAGKNDMPTATWERIKEIGHRYFVYDTAKVANILFQTDGHSLVHKEHDALLHIGGLSHYLAPPNLDFHGEVTSGEFEGEAGWVKQGGVESRAAVARFTAHMLRELTAGRPAPPVPAEADPAHRHKIESIHVEIQSMVENATPWLALTGE